MTPSELTSLYEDLARNVNAAVDHGACKPVSVRPPSSFEGELEFLRLVGWGFAVLAEAARVPCAFLGELPPRSAVTATRAELSKLRTYLNHNLDDKSASDRKTIEFLKRWFRGACGKDFPSSADDYSACSCVLGQVLKKVLEDLLAASALLADPNDGPGLCDDLRYRVSFDWPAFKYDQVAAIVGGRIGVAGIDLVKLREKRLDAWRKSLISGERGREVLALEFRIEADLVEECAGALPVSAQEVVNALDLASGSSLIAALLAIRAAHFAGVQGIGELLAIARRQ